MTRLAIFATHPIQYQVPWFQALAVEPELDTHVYYAMLPDPSQQGSGFDVAFNWDIPLLEGYAWTLLENSSPNPSLQTFGGCYVRGLKRALRTALPDVALVTGWNSAYLLQSLQACKRLRIPVIVRGDSNVIKPRGSVRRWLLSRLVHRFDGFLAVGKSNRVFFQEAGIPDDRIFPCGHFVDNNRFGEQANALRPARFELRRRWGIAEKAVCFVFVGKLIAKKRVMDFLRAIAGASRRGGSVFGLVVGTGEQMDQASSFVESGKVPVTFAGFLNQNELASVYVAADCLVLPSDYGETWGLVVNEAMACGVPAIVSDEVGCGSDLVIENETGAVFPMGDADALGEVMARFAADQERLKAMGEAARELVATAYSVDRGVDGVKVAIDCILDQQVST